jgi:hypothetical protein
MASNLRINNYNYAGIPILFGLIVAPPLLVFLTWAWVTGEMLPDECDVPEVMVRVLETIGAAIPLVLVMIAALRWTVLWIEIGADITVRCLLSKKTYAWDELAEFEWDREESHLPLLKEPYARLVPGATVPLGSHRILVLKHRDGKVIGRVLIDRRNDYRLARLLRQRWATQNVEAQGGSVAWNGTTVSQVSFVGTGLTDEQLVRLYRSLESFPDLEHLDLSGTRVTDRGIEYLKALEQIRTVKAGGTAVSVDAHNELGQTRAKAKANRSMFPPAL